MEVVYGAIDEKVIIYFGIQWIERPHCSCLTKYVRAVCEEF